MPSPPQRPDSLYFISESLKWFWPVLAPSHSHPCGRHTCAVCLINSNPHPSHDLGSLCQGGTKYFSDLSSETLTSPACLSFPSSTNWTAFAILLSQESWDSWTLDFSMTPTPCPYYFICNSSLQLSRKFLFTFLTHYSLFNLDYHCSLTFLFHVIVIFSPRYNLHCRKSTISICTLSIY